LGLRDIENYLEVIDKDPDTRNACQELITVSVSRFFRDKKLWEILEKEILPDIAGMNECTIRAWSAGCASGEEVYSLKLIWESSRFNNSNFPELNITATDINPRYIKRAREGVYNSSSLREVPEHIRAKYFQKLPGKKLYQVDPAIKKDITWLVRDLFRDPPLGPFQIIFLRNNILTYYKEEMKKPIIDKIINSLATGAYLVIGSHEHLPHDFDKQLEYELLSFVYRKKQLL
jgi:chemotaxis protein methyltransferase CheR